MLTKVTLNNNSLKNNLRATLRQCPRSGSEWPEDRSSS